MILNLQMIIMLDLALHRMHNLRVPKFPIMKTCLHLLKEKPWSQSQGGGHIWPRPVEALKNGMSISFRLDMELPTWQRQGNLKAEGWRTSQLLSLRTTRHTSSFLVMIYPCLLCKLQNAESTKNSLIMEARSMFYIRPCLKR